MILVDAIAVTLVGLAAALQVSAPATDPPEPPLVAVPPPATPGAEADAEVETLDEVVVRGRRDAVSSFVNERTAVTGRNRVARWSGAICPGVVGLPRKYGALLADRVSQEAQAVGLDVGAPGCKADLLILVTDDGKKAAQDFYRARPHYFAKHYRSESSESGGGGQTVDEFLNTTRPVRWWHVSRLTGSDGRAVQFVNFSPTIEGAGGVKQSLDGGVGVPFVQAGGSSRLASQLKENLVRAVVIVDAAQARGVSYEALGSYLALVGLAQLDPDGDRAGLPSVFSLFEDKSKGVEPSTTLTTWDRAYLRGLYASRDDARSDRAQRSAIRRSLREVANR